MKQEVEVLLHGLCVMASSMALVYVTTSSDLEVMAFYAIVAIQPWPNSLFLLDTFPVFALADSAPPPPPSKICIDITFISGYFYSQLRTVLQN